MRVKDIKYIVDPALKIRVYDAEQVVAESKEKKETLFTRQVLPKTFDECEVYRLEVEADGAIALTIY